MTNNHTPPEGWWNAYRKTFPAAVVALFEAEARAESAQFFSASAFPVPVQHPDYAEAVLRSYDDSFTAEKIRAAIAARAMRRAAYVDGGPKTSIIVDASVLRRPVGSDAIMATQRAWARKLHSSGKTPISVLDGFYYGEGITFSVFSVAGEVVAFEDTEAELVQVDDARRDVLITRFAIYSARASDLLSHPLMSLPE
jgi:hypothetical protein